MKPPAFSYHAPATVAEAVALLGRLDNARALAGGQSLMPMLAMRYVLPDHLVDLNRVAGLSYIREVPGAVEIGAMTRQRDIELSDLVRAACPLMHEALPLVGHRQTRNRGTLGGSLVHLDPAAELVCVAAALDATVVIEGAAGRRELDFAGFPLGYMTPALEPGEILIAARFPTWPKGHGHAFVEVARRHGDFAVVSAAALLVLDGVGRIARAALALGGVGPAPVRMTAIEAELAGAMAAPGLFARVSALAREIDAAEDANASAAYRRHLAGVLARRALERAFGRAAGGGAP